MNQDDFRRLLAERRDGASPGEASRPGRLGPRERTLGFAPRRSRQVIPAKEARPSGAAKRQKVEPSTPAAGEDGVFSVDESEKVAQLQQRLRAGKITHSEYISETQGLGGDVATSHQVRGLDRRLLERVRAGEDVFGPASANGAAAVPHDADHDEELDRFLLAETRKTTEAAEPETDVGPGPAGQPGPGAQKASKFRPIDQPPEPEPAPEREYREEIRYENHKKVKLIYDAQGNLVKRLAKKMKEKDYKEQARLEHEAAENAHKANVPDAQRADTLPDAAGMVSGGPPPAAGPEPDDDDAAIFEGYGAYDPFGDDDEEPAGGAERPVEKFQVERDFIAHGTAATEIFKRDPTMREALKRAAQSRSTDKASRHATEETAEDRLLRKKDVQAGFGLELSADVGYEDDFSGTWDLEEDERNKTKGHKKSS